MLEVNEARLEEGLSPLKVAPLLFIAAAKKGEHMADGLYFAHNSPEGYSPWYFYSLSGYRYSQAGENLAIDFISAEAVVDAMMLSPAHRANILGLQYTDLGIAVVPTLYGGYERYMVVMLFGRPL